jgi:general secretion pathway protein M
MTSGSLTLPEGRPGQLLAVGVTLIGLAIIWITAIAPVFSWYEARADLLAQQQMTAANMAALIRETPQLRAAVAAARPQTQDQQILVPGATDDIAGANLQSALQSLAQASGTSLDSSAVMPVQVAGALHHIGIQVSVTATWPVLIGFLEAISTARPRMIVEQLSLINAAQGDNAGDQPVQASFTVGAFTAGTP